MLFDWDPKKAAANARKHRVTFKQEREEYGDGNR